MHGFWGGHFGVLGRVEGDRMLDVERDDAVFGCDFCAGVVGEVESGVRGGSEETLVPPFDVRGGFYEEVLFGVEIFVDAGAAAGLCDTLFHGFKGGLAAESGGLLDVFAFLVEDELFGAARAQAGCLGSEGRVEVGIVARLFEGGSREVELVLDFIPF